jgi:ribosomal-protein-alanine N-acetyltransferase
MSPSPEAALALVDVTEDVLERLLCLAVRDADADEVTPPLGSAPGWNPERISWFREYHRAAAAGLDGPARQQSWAISCGGLLAGATRLQRTGHGLEKYPWLEAGIWLGRGFRGRGVGTEALRLLKAEAAGYGATGLEAHTTAGNAAALALLRSAGAVLGFGAECGVALVTARIPLR